VALIECGTHAVIDAAIGGRQQGETTLAMDLVLAAGTGTLVLADRGMPGVPLWTAFREAGAHLLWRLKRTTGLRVDKILPDGSYLTSMCLDKNSQAAYRRRGQTLPGPVVLRVIEYAVAGSDEVYRLGTSLLDHEAAPANELAVLYTERWESEGIYAEIKTAQRGPRTVLQSGHPQGVRQEIWAHLIVHHLTRDLMLQAAGAVRPPLDPDRISFRAAQRLARRDLSPLVSPSEAHRRARQVADKLAARPNAPRDHRSYPRVVKRRTTQFCTKQLTDQGIHPPRAGQCRRDPGSSTVKATALGPGPGARPTPR
jgi:hypothetical protein